MPYLGWSRLPRPKAERRPAAGGGRREPDPRAWELWWGRGEAGCGGHGWGWGGGRATTHVTTATGEAGVILSASDRRRGFARRCEKLYWANLDNFGGVWQIRRSTTALCFDSVKFLKLKLSLAYI
jgi:hypothetical protein